MFIARPSRVKPSGIFLLLFLLLLLPIALPGQVDDEWEKERSELFEQYHEFFTRDGGSHEADSILTLILKGSIAHNDTIGQMKAWVSKINHHLNNEHTTDSLCNHLLPLMPEDDDQVWSFYYRYRSYACALRGEYTQQMLYLDSAVARSTQFGDSTIISQTHTELSLASQDVQNYSEALASARKALAYLPKSTPSLNYAYSLRNIGICHHKATDLDSAIFYYAKARKIYADLKNLGEEMYTYALIGRVEYDNGNPHKANKILEEVAGVLFSPNNSSYTLESFNYIYVWLAESYIETGNQAAAIKNAKTAYQITDSLNQEVNRLQALRVLIKAELGRDTEAYAHFNEYVTSQENLYKAENEEAIIEYERKYKAEEAKLKAKEAEQKVLLLERDAQEAEIEMQNIRFWVFLVLALFLVGALIAGIFVLRNRIRTRQRMDQLRLKALQLQINPHFFFNVLNSISNFIGRNDQKSAHFFLARFAKLMRSTLEYSRENVVELGKELEFLKTYLDLEKLRNDHFDYEVICPEELLSRSIPPMLLQPFAENCVVHAFSEGLPERGMIRISAKKVSEFIELVIEDNGVGFSEDHSEEQEKGKTSLAIRILKDRLSVYGKKAGKFSIEKAFPDKKEAPGTRVILQIPLI